MKKDIEWLKGRFRGRKIFKPQNDREIGYNMAIDEFSEYVDQLDEPEVLSQDWIENPGRDLDSMYIWESPKYVYDWTFGKDDSLENSRYKDLLDAIDNGYEVEDEQKYFVSSRESVGFWFLSKNNDNEVVIGTNKDYYDRKWESLKLTEEEIKDYDARYMFFAIPVEENE